MVDGETRTVTMRDSNPPRAARTRKTHFEEDAAVLEAQGGTSAAGVLLDGLIGEGPSASGGPLPAESPRDGAATPAESASNELILTSDPSDVVRPLEQETTQLVRMEHAEQPCPGRDSYGTHTLEVQRKYRRLNPLARPPTASRGRSPEVAGSLRPLGPKRRTPARSAPAKRCRLQPKLSSRRADRIDDSTFFDNWVPRHERADTDPRSVTDATSAADPSTSNPCGERSPEQLGTPAGEVEVSILPAVQWHGVTIDQSVRSSPRGKRTRPRTPSPPRPPSPRQRPSNDALTNPPLATRRRVHHTSAPRIRGDLYLAGLSELPEALLGTDRWLPDLPQPPEAPSLEHWRQAATLTPLHLRTQGAHHARRLRS